MARIARAARGLRRLDRERVRDLWAAECALARAQLMVWRRPTGALLGAGPRGPLPGAFLGAFPGAFAIVAGHPADVPARMARIELRREAERLARAIHVAARMGPIRPACLARALALNQLLESRGISGSRLRIGVRLQGGRFDAHAWVEYGGVVVGDDPLFPLFVPLSATGARARGGSRNP